MEQKIKNMEGEMFYIERDSKEDVPRLTYDKSDEKNELELIETYVPEDMRKRGLAAKIVTHALDYARDNGYRVIPTCGYVQSFLKKHEEYDSILKQEWQKKA